MAVNRTPDAGSAQDSAREVLDQVRAYVEYQQSTGLDAIPRRPRPAVVAPTTTERALQPAIASAPTPPARPAPAPRAVASAPDLFVTPGVRRATTLEELRAEL